MMTLRLAESLRHPFVAVGVGTLGLGLTVAVSWFVFGGAAAFRGPIRQLELAWPLIYASQATLAAAGVFLFARLAQLASFRQLTLVVLAAWAGEWIVLLVGGRLFANELMPDFASFYWLIGTGGPIQPLAAMLGGWLALRR